MWSPLHSTRPYERVASGDGMADPKHEIQSVQSHHAVTSPPSQASQEGRWWQLHGGSGPSETDHAKLPCGHLSTLPGFTRGQLVVTPHMSTLCV